MPTKVYMNARRIEHDKIKQPDGQSKLYPVIFQPGYIYEVPDVTAKAWCKVFVALPIAKNGTVALRDGTEKKLSPKKIQELTREPDRPNRPVLGGTRPSLDDAETAEAAPTPIAPKKKRKRKAAKAGKTTTRGKASKKSKKKGKRGKKKK